jgi:DNA-directed RNA polymerase specialized sigma24 family protein
MNYLNELRLKKELVLINTSNKMTEEDEEFDNRDVLDSIIQEYDKETYNVRKGELEEKFTKEVTKTKIRNYSKEKFGEQVLMLIHNLLKKHCFSGYTQEYKEDFAIDAIEKIFKYSHNFDPTKISDRSGKRVKAFAYLTQITTQAFISVINKKNDDKNKAKEYDVISYSSLYNNEFVDKLFQEDNYSKFEQEEVLDAEYFIEDIEEVFGILTKAKNKEYKNIKIVYSEEIQNIPMATYNLIMKAKPEDLNLILTKKYIPEITEEMCTLEDVAVEAEEW